jgi:short-subunit dehydrogenase
MYMLQAYIESLTAALRFEVRGTGVHVQTLTPVFVNTNMLAFSGVLMKMPISSAPHIYAKHSVDTLGISGDTAGYWPHEIQVNYG